MPPQLQNKLIQNILQNWNCDVTIVNINKTSDDSSQIMNVSVFS